MTVDSLNPTAGAPGTLVAILGSGLAAATAVKFSGLGRELAVAPSYVSATELRAYVPSWDGDGGTVQVSAADPDGESAAIDFEVLGYPALEAVYPLCSLAMVKRLLGVAPDVTVAEEQLRAMIDGASAAITREIGLDFRLCRIVDQRLDGDGTAMLPLPRGPVVSVEGLRIDGFATDAAEVKVYPTYLRFEDSFEDYNPRLRSTGRVFAKGRQNIGVDYTVGYAAVPYDVAGLCVEQVLWLQNTLGKTGVLAETNSVANNSTTYSQQPLAPHVLRGVNRWRPVRVAVI